MEAVCCAQSGFTTFPECAGLHLFAMSSVLAARKIMQISQFLIRHLCVNGKLLAWVLTCIFTIFTADGVAYGQHLERWVYAPVNFLVPAEADRLDKLMRDAKRLAYTHVLITDSKFCRLHEMDKKYFAHIERIKGLARELNLQLVPAVFPVGYSNNLLSQNVNLAEGLPVRDALFEVRDSEAQIVPDPGVSLPSFSERKEWRFIDEPLKPEGDGLRVTEPNGENCRAMKTLAVSPFRHYHISVRVKTENFRGQPQITVLEPETGRRLTHTNLKVGRTQDWSVQHITFNSLANSSVNVYIGAWGPTGGSMWLADPVIEECGLLNVLRRPGTPVKVTIDEDRTRELREGVDYDVVRDDRLGNVPYAGEYEVWHESPPIRMKGSWANGTRLRVSWYHPHVVYDGQVCACVTEPEFVQLLREHAAGVEKIFPGTDRMMSHDEWRVMGWDESFRRLEKTPGQVAADNVRLCTEILRDQRADCRIFVWNDMFDPHHNAVDNYYLVNGDLSGSWNGLDKDVVIMNWNFGVRAESLKFFDERGHRQVLAGFYDADAEQIGKWLDTVRKDNVSNVVGVMYTTWQQDYSQLKEFRDVVDRFEAAPPQ